MELKEALVELGLDPADRHDEATVRRAYLKGVKVRKPETDPEGFRRLREAYELLRVFGPALARHATPDVPAVEVRSESPSPPDLPPPPADGPGVDPLTPYLDRLDALPAQPWLDRLAVAREAFRALPDHPRVEDLLLDIITASNARTDQVVAGLLPLVQEGDPASRWLLLTRHPKQVPLDELARLRREGTPGQRLATAAAYLEQDRGDDAVATMEELLASDRDREGGLLLQYQALRFTLALYRRSLLPQARRAFAAVKAYMGAAGAPQVGEAAAVTATLYLLCSELEAVPDLPKEFRQDVTRGVLEGDLGVASFTVRAFQRMHGARATRRWHRTLKKQAPMIASVLQWTEPRERFSLGQMLRQGWWGAAVVLFFIGRLVMNQSSSGPTQAYNQIVMTDPAIEAVEQSIADLSLNVLAVCDSGRNPLLAGPADRPEAQQMQQAIEAVCPSLQMLSRALQANSCPTARATLADLRARGSNLPVTVGSHIESVGRRVDIQCPP